MTCLSDSVDRYIYINNNSVTFIDLVYTYLIHRPWVVEVSQYFVVCLYLVGVAFVYKVVIVAALILVRIA